MKPDMTGWQMKVVHAEHGWFVRYGILGWVWFINWGEAMDYTADFIERYCCTILHGMDISIERMQDNA